MPTLTDDAGDPASQFIAHTPHGGYFGPTDPRKPFGRHTFQGANAPMLEILAELLPAKREILEKSAERARATLRSALGMTVSGDVEGDRLTARVQLVNQSGHKLPSGFPSRRMWLHLSVTDGAGKTVFESGAFDASSGELTTREAGVAPHLDVVDDPKQTMIYEAEMGDTGGHGAVSLMRAAKCLKDNRLLPRAFADGLRWGRATILTSAPGATRSRIGSMSGITRGRLGSLWRPFIRASSRATRGRWMRRSRRTRRRF